MSESIIADFTTRLIPDVARYPELVRGRVLLSDRRLVLATSDERVTIPLGEVFDVTYGQAPSELASFDGTVTVGYRSGRNRQIAVVEGALDVVHRFTTLLFKAILNRTPALVEHPAEDDVNEVDEENGMNEDRDYSPIEATLGVGDALTLVGPARIAIEVATIAYFERRTWTTTNGDTRPVLAVRHVPVGGRAATTEIALGSARKLHPIGRYLRLSSAYLESQLADVTVTGEETAVLVACYTGRDASLPRILGADANHVTMIQRGLAEKGLLTDNGTTLTPLGRLVAGRHVKGAAD